MSEISKKPVVVKYLVVLLSFELASCYESAYDLIERKNQRRYFNEPNRYFESSESFVNRYNDGDGLRYSTHNRKPNSIYSSIKPLDVDRSFRSSFIGNGYDNLGNGGFGESRGGFGESRGGFGESRGGFGESRGGFGESRGGFGESRGGFAESRRGLRDRYDGDRETGPFYNRRFDYEDQPQYIRRRSYSRRHHDDYPEFYERDYFVRPKYDERTINLERKNLDKNYGFSSGEKGNSGLSKTNSLVANNEDKKQKKTDTGFKSSQEGANVDVANNEKYGESAHIDKNGENKSTIRSNKVTKKGHTTKGFSSHHHKDETGNTTTFFDESSDHGGQSDFRDVADEYGTRKTVEQFNNKEDGKFFKENGGESGNYGSGYLKDNQKFEKDVLTNDNHYDKEEKFREGEEKEDLGFRRSSHLNRGGRQGFLESGIDFDDYYKKK